MKRIWLVGMAALVGCKSDASKNPEAADMVAAGSPKSSGAKAGAKTDTTVEAKAAEIAARPRVTVAIESLDLQLQAPEGTKVVTTGAPLPGRAHLETGQGEFMLNLSAVHEYSTESFADASTVDEPDKLIEWITKEETPTGWVTYKLVDSELHKRRSFEVDVRTKVGGKAWNCGVSAPSKIYSDIALEACKSLEVAGSTPAPAGSEGPTVGTAKPAKTDATKTATATATTSAKPAAPAAAFD